MPRKLSNEEFIEKAKLVHEDKYSYENINYINNYTKINITCKIHEDFLQRPRDHLVGYGCFKCGLYKLSNLFRLTKEDFIKKAILIHSDKYFYENINYINSHFKITILCLKCNKLFNQTPNSHLNGSGCPTCKESHGERLIKNYLLYNNVNLEKEKSFSDCINPKTNKKLRFDFYLPDHNLLIEFDGMYHYSLDFLLTNGYITEKKYIQFYNNKRYIEENNKLKYRDNIKNYYCKINNIELLRIPFWEKENIIKILYNKLNLQDYNVS